MNWIGLTDDTSIDWLWLPQQESSRFYEDTEVVGRMEYCHFFKKNYAAWVYLLPE
jgi:hypothetical protein